MEEEVLSKSYDSRLMRRLLTYLWPYRALILGALFFLILNSVLQVAGPLLTKVAIDRYLAPNPDRIVTPIDALLPAEPVAGLTRIALLYLAALFGIFVFEFAQMCIMQYIGQKAMFDLRRQLMTHLQELDIAFYDRNPVGRLVTRVTTDVDVLNELFASGLVTILGDLLTLAFVVFTMLKLSLVLTAIVLAVLPFVVFATVLFRRSVAQSYRRIRVAIARINAYLQEHIVGIAVLQLFNREKKSAEEFDEINRQHMLAFKDTIVAYGWFYPVVEFLSALAIAAILSYGGWGVERGAVTIGVVVAFLQYATRFFRPIQDLSEKYNILQSAMASSERVFNLLDTKVEIKAPARDLQAPWRGVAHRVRSRLVRVQG